MVVLGQADFHQRLRFGFAYSARIEERLESLKFLASGAFFSDLRKNYKMLTVIRVPHKTADHGSNKALVSAGFQLICKRHRL